jgi:solute:Na+ symporter, SSS family
MIRSFRFFLFAAAFFVFPFCSSGQIQKQLKWESLPSLPAAGGISGMYVGVSHGAVLCMGGQQTTSGSWSDSIRVLASGADSWRSLPSKLPSPMGFGMSFSYHDRIILAGGCDNNKYFAEVYAVVYLKEGIRIEKFPQLPFPLAHMTGCVSGDVLFIAGGDSTRNGKPLNSFLALNLLDPHPQWKMLAPFPGQGRLLAVSSSLHNDFFLFGGYTALPDADAEMKKVGLSDACRFVPEYQGSRLSGGKWSVLAAIPEDVLVTTSPAPTVGMDHILFPGNFNGAGKLSAYDVKTDSWMDFGSPNVKVRVPRAVAVKRNQDWLFIADKTTADEKEAVVFALSKNLSFGWLNWLTLGVYLALMVCIGIMYDKRGQTTNNFFTAGGRIPWWAAGLSIYGSQISAITFMAIPAIVYSTDWTLALGSFVIFATVPIVTKYYIPFFRRLNVTSAYEYLEHRFSASVRLMGSLSFILFQMGRMGIVLYLPAVAIASVTGIDTYLLILIMGLICILYTVMGGIEAVVWTDVAQVIILLGGAILCFFVAVYHIDGGFRSMVRQGIEGHKFTLFRLGWKPDSLVLWVGIVGFFFLNLIPYTSDQTVVQRYLTVKNEKQAARSLWVNAWITVPGTLVFFGLGTVLYVFYKDNPGIISSEKIDEILPYFVVQQLPAGLSGIVIAGIFAASQSTLSSSMNSVSATFFSDIYQRNRKNITGRETLRVARLVTVFAGIFGAASAMIIAFLNVEFIFDLFQEVLGILGGSLAGVFILGIFTARANTIGAIAGVIVSVITVWTIRNGTTISVYLYGAISVVTCVLTGYLISLFVPSAKNAVGFNYASIKKMKITAEK